MKEKQIEEMARIICNLCTEEGCLCDGGYCNFNCHDYERAKRFYNAGFRKQSEGEWISVEDRLPTYKDGKVLIYTAYGISIAEITVSGRWKGANAIPKFITHWMPLPELPKMKGE